MKDLQAELGSWTAEELQAEVDRRKEEERQQVKPKLLDEPDIASLQQLCEKYISDEYNDQADIEDWQQWFYEGILNAFFGNVVWDWLDQQEE